MHVEVAELHTVYGCAKESIFTLVGMFKEFSNAKYLWFSTRHSTLHPLFQEPLLLCAAVQARIKFDSLVEIVVVNYFPKFNKN